MTTVEQFIKYLQTLPQDAIVQCLEEKRACYEVYTEWKSLDIENDISVIDLRNNQFIEEDSPNFGKVFIEIGDK